MYSFSDENIFIFLIQIFLLLGASRILGELFRRWKQPALTAEIIVGILLGPTILGRISPALFKTIFPGSSVQINMLETVAWLGLLFFLLETGLKMDFSSAWRHRGKALAIALTDIIFPMSLAFTLSLFIPDAYLVDPASRMLFAFFMGTVLTISAMPIAVRALHDLNLTKTDLGFLIMSALSVNEIIGWILFMCTLRLFSPGSFGLEYLFLNFIAIIGFVVFCLTIGRRLTDFFVSRIKKYDLPEPGSSLTFICLLGILCGALFQKLGINALIGFFIAGIMAGEARNLPERTKQVISQMVYAIFIPLFFAGIGLRLDFVKSFDLLLVLFVTSVGIFGKFFGAWLGAKLARISKEDVFAVAIAHTPGGSMEIVVGMLALQYGLINERIFVAIVFGALASSIAVGPWLKYALNKRKEIKILELLTRGNCLADLKAFDRTTAIEELCRHAFEQSNTLNADTVIGEVLRREQVMGTAVENGLAFPHARLACLLRPQVLFGRAKAGIEWDSPDGHPTQYIFLILTPKEDDWAQVQILRVIAKTMDNPSMRKSVLEAGDANQLWETLKQCFTQQLIFRR